MAQIKKTVKPTGGDYSALETCLNANEQDLTDAGGDYLDVEIDGDWSSADTLGVAIHNYTTSATCYINIYTTAAARHAGVWSTSKYRLSISNAGVWVAEDYVRIDGLQVEIVSPASNNLYVMVVSGQVASNSIRVSNCVLKGHGHATYNGNTCLRIDDADLNVVCWNCVMYNVTANGLTGNYVVHFRAGTTLSLYGCTLIGGTTAYFQNASGTGIAKNCYAGGGSSTDWQSTAGTFTKTTCASEDATGSSGLTGILVSTDADSTHAGFTIVTAGSENFTLKVGSPLIGVGTTLSDEALPATMCHYSTESWSFAHTTARKYMASSFTCTGTYSAVKLDVSLTATATPPTGVVTAYLYSDSSGTPGTVLGTSTNTVDDSTFGSTPSYGVWTFSGVNLTHGTKYWVALSNSTVNGTNYLAIRDGSVTGQNIYASADGSSWSSVVSNARWDFALYFAASTLDGWGVDIAGTTRS